MKKIEKLSQTNLLLFVGLILGSAYALNLIMWLEGAGEAPKGFMAYKFIGMWLPTIMTFGFLIWKFKGIKAGLSQINWGLGKWPYLILACLIPVAITIVTAKILHATGMTEIGIDRFVTIGDDGYTPNKFKLLLGNGAQSLPMILGNLVITAIVGSLIYMPMGALGEEITWRGYLQGQLNSRFGVTKGLILLGIIWGYWHAGVILLGLNFPDYPILGALVIMPLQSIAFCFLMGWITIKSGSMWPAVLMHASINMFLGIVFSLTPTGTALSRDLVTLGILTLVAIPCFLSLRKTIINV